MFRYIVLYINGGTYTDTDTLCVKPISSWSDGNDVEYNYQGKVQHLKVANYMIAMSDFFYFIH